MTDKQNHPKPSPKHQLLLAQLAELKLAQIAEIYAQVLDDAARKNSSAFDVLSALFGAEIAARHQRALARRIREARLPPRKTVEEFDFAFPKRDSPTKDPAAVRLRVRHATRLCGLHRPTGTGKTHFLTVLGYAACERQFTVRFTRVVDMLNELTTAQIQGTLRKTLRPYTVRLVTARRTGLSAHRQTRCRPDVPSRRRRYERGATVVSTNRPFRDWGKTFDLTTPWPPL